ncbi:MAG: hypothetical protein JNM63_07885, partial [Spirochaetia bacterium]|nr:hypothetical protein [Spirochaetia bacterium]
PFIRIKGSSGVNGLTFWYPEQSAENPVAYPPTTEGTGGTLENVTFVNSWRAYTSDLAENSLYFIRNIYGTSLSVGLEIDAAFDIGRIENVHFSPAYWSESGLKGAPAANGNLKTWLYDHGVGIIMRRNDWSYLYNVSIKGYRAGFKTLVSICKENVRKNQKGYGNGWNDKLVIEHCQNAIEIDNASSGMGISFSRLTVTDCENGLVCSDAFADKLQFLASTISANKDAIRCPGNGIIQMQSSKIISGRLRFENGSLLMTDCDLENGAPQLALSADVKNAALVGNRFRGEPQIQIDPKLKMGSNVVIDHSPKILERMSPYPYRVPDTRTAAKRTLFSVAEAPYNAKGDGVSDDTSALLKALDDAGKNGGGIVFLKPGEYRITEGLKVPTGVELRGSFEAQHRMEPKGSVIFVAAGKGSENGTPFITLSTRSGVRGLSFHYPEQDHAAVSPYPFLIRGNGSGVYVVNVTASCVYQFIDLATVRCDDHYVDYAAGAPLKAGVLVGGGSVNGRVYNVQFNPSYFTFTRTYSNSFPRTGDRSGMSKAYHSYEWTNHIAFGFGNCSGEIIHANFV